MKFHKQNMPAPNAFTPVSLTFQIETLAEAQAFYFLFNYSPLVEGLSLRDVSEDVRNTLQQHCHGVIKEFNTHRDRVVSLVRR